MHEHDYEQFYGAAWRRVITFLYAVSGDQIEAQDLAQEAFARAWQHWSTVRAYDDPEAWVRTVGYRLYLNKWRKARNRLVAYRRHGVGDPATAPSENTVALVAALRKLSADQRQAIALHHLMDLSVEEVARQTSTSVNTVKSRLVRGRRVLAELLGTELSPEATHA